jgi:hypothetical protein
VKKGKVEGKGRNGKLTDNAEIITEGGVGI